MNCLPNYVVGGADVSSIHQSNFKPKIKPKQGTSNQLTGLVDAGNMAAMDENLDELRMNETGFSIQAKVQRIVDSQIGEESKIGGKQSKASHKEVANVLSFRNEQTS